MKAKLLTVGAITALIVGAVIGSLDAKLRTINISVNQLCPDYDTNPELEALINCVDPKGKARSNRSTL